LRCERTVRVVVSASCTITGVTVVFRAIEVDAPRAVVAILISDPIDLEINRTRVHAVQHTRITTISVLIQHITLATNSFIVKRFTAFAVALQLAALIARDQLVAEATRALTVQRGVAAARIASTVNNFARRLAHVQVRVVHALVEARKRRIRRALTATVCIDKRLV